VKDVDVDVECNCCRARLSCDGGEIEARKGEGECGSEQMAGGAGLHKGYTTPLHTRRKQAEECQGRGRRHMQRVRCVHIAYHIGKQTGGALRESERER
jgi:hypothetical protein